MGFVGLVVVLVASEVVGFVGRVTEDFVGSVFAGWEVVDSFVG